jgi:hypothetical protein
MVVNETGAHCSSPISRRNCGSLIIFFGISLFRFALNYSDGRSQEGGVYAAAAAWH